MSSQEIQNSSLSIRRLMLLPAKARLDAIIDSQNAQALVRAMPAQDLYSTILDVGLADANELVQMASAEQFRACIDLAAWNKDRVDAREVLVWLRAARGDEAESFLKKLHGLDLEVIEYMFRSLIRVHDLEEHPDVNPPGVTMESPEGKYLLEFLVDGAELAALRAVVQDLISEDPFKAGRFFEAVRWEMLTELEDTAFQFRSARLADLGFPPLYEALALYAYTDPDKWVKSEVRGIPAEGLEKQPGQRIDYVDAAFRTLVSTEQENLEDEIRYMVNSALVAEGAEPGDPLAVRRVSEMARDYLQLGLEHLCQGNPQRAGDVVQEFHLKRVFQVGFSLTLQLKFKLDRLAKTPCTKVGDTWLVLPDLQPAMKALHRRRPLRALKVEGAEPVPFRDRRELNDSSALIDRAFSQTAVFSGILSQDITSVEKSFGMPLTQLSPERLFSAVTAHAVLDGEIRLGPVNANRLIELAERWIEDSQGRPTVRASMIEKACHVIEARVEAQHRNEVGKMVKWVSEWVADEIGQPFLAEGRLNAALLTRLPLFGL